jgi:L-rhamnose isomerase/sugar isomerase
VSLHIPWDKPDDATKLREFAGARGLSFDAMNSNTFQDQPGQKHSYKFGSLTHPDEAVRRQAIDHNIECIQLGQTLGSRAHTVWIGDGGNFPGQQHFRGALERYLESMREIYAALPDDWRLFIEHKFYEPAFYSTVINDWGTSYYCARELGPKAFCLVDLGHHAPNVNIEMIVARLIQFGKLAGFHFNDSKYGDDDLDSGSIKPFQLFLIFNELVDAELNRAPNFNPAYMLDQSHNVTDPIESLMMSAVELVRAYVQAHLIDRDALAEAQQQGDPLRALSILKQAFTTDVAPLLAMARERDGGAIDPISTYRASGYRRHKGEERPANKGAAASGIV